jgi:hypothetical protein
VKSHELARQLLALPDLRVWCEAGDDYYSGEVSKIAIGDAAIQTVVLPQLVGRRRKRFATVTLLVGGTDYSDANTGDALEEK